MGQQQPFCNFLSSFISGLGFSFFLLTKKFCFFSYFVFFLISSFQHSLTNPTCLKPPHPAGIGRTEGPAKAGPTLLYRPPVNYGEPLLGVPRPGKPEAGQVLGPTSRVAQGRGWKLRSSLPSFLGPRREVKFLFRKIFYFSQRESTKGPRAPPISAINQSVGLSCKCSLHHTLGRMVGRVTWVWRKSGEFCRRGIKRDRGKGPKNLVEGEDKYYFKKARSRVSKD